MISLFDITNIIMGQLPKSSSYNEDGKGLPFYQGKAEFGVNYPTPVKWCSKPGSSVSPEFYPGTFRSRFPCRRTAYNGGFIFA